MVLCGNIKVDLALTGIIGEPVFLFIVIHIFSTRAEWYKLHMLNIFNLSRQCSLSIILINFKLTHHHCTVLYKTQNQWHIPRVNLCCIQKGVISLLLNFLIIYHKTYQDLKMIYFKVALRRYLITQTLLSLEDFSHNQVTNSLTSTLL